MWAQIKQTNKKSSTACVALYCVSCCGYEDEIKELISDLNYKLVKIWDHFTTHVTMYTDIVSSVLNNQPGADKDSKGVMTPFGTNHQHVPFVKPVQ